jgi:hypothetical protein
MNYEIIVTTPKIAFSRTHEECDAPIFFHKNQALILCLAVSAKGSKLNTGTAQLVSVHDDIHFY